MIQIYAWQLDPGDQSSDQIFQTRHISSIFKVSQGSESGSFKELKFQCKDVLVIL